MVLFVFSAVYEQYERATVHNNDTLDWAWSLFAIVAAGAIPYMAGKVVAEQPGVRLEAVRRYTWLLAGAALLSIPEFLKQINLFRRFWVRFFPGQYLELVTATRNGFGRLGGPYGGAEQAGIVIFVGLSLALWLTFLSSPGPDPKPEKKKGVTPLRWKRIGMICVLGLTLYMTQARGPWLGMAASLAIASIGAAKRPLRRAIFVLTLGIFIGVPGYNSFKEYASGPRKDYGSERETAQYRTQLIDNYIPVAKAGGAWGYGPKFPIIEGQTSIDNEYLLVWLIQGYMGVIALVLLMTEAALSLVLLGIKKGPRNDRAFAFSMLGIIAGIAVTIGTVFLGSEPYQIFFLLIGWSQGIRPPDPNTPPYPMRIYT